MELTVQQLTETVTEILDDDRRGPFTKEERERVLNLIQPGAKFSMLTSERGNYQCLGKVAFGNGNYHGFGGRLDKRLIERYNQFDTTMLYIT